MARHGTAWGVGWQWLVGGIYFQAAAGGGRWQQVAAGTGIKAAGSGRGGTGVAGVAGAAGGAAASW